MTAPSPAEVLDQIAARADAAADGPWEVIRTTEHSEVEVRSSTVVDARTEEPQFVATTGDPHYDGTLNDAEFIANARTDVPRLVAALRAVHRPDMVQRPEWLGDKVTFDSEDAEEPGNDAYLDYLDRVLTAAGYTDIPWGPIFVAITLDRLVRANEDHAAITSALGGAA